MNKFLVLSGLVLLISACGGSNNENSNQIEETPTNTPPVAVIKSSENFVTDTLITLDGSSSTDDDGDDLSYQWKLQTQPSGSLSILTSSNESTASFTPDLPGNYKVELIVNDGSADSEAKSITLSVEQKSLSPVAVISGFEKVAVGGRYQLDASNSYDEDGEISAFYWQLLSKPEGSEVAIDNGFTWEEKPALYDDSAKSWFHFSPDVKGNYSIQLTVVDNDKQASEKVVVNFEAVINESPVSELVYMGGVRNLFGGEQYVYLDVSDQDNDEITYNWSMKSLPELSSFSQQASTTSYFAIKTDVEGKFDFEYEFTDGYYSIDSSMTSSTQVFNTYPKVINTGGNENEEVNFENQFSVNSLFWTMPIGYLNTEVELDFSGIISPSGAALTYDLELVKGPDGAKAVTTHSQTSPELISFKADKEGFYTFDLTVSDGTQTVSTWPTVAGRLSIMVKLVDNSESVSITGNIPKFIFIKNDELATLSADSIQSENFLTYRWSLDSDIKPQKFYTEASLTQDVYQTLEFERLGVNNIALEVTDEFGGSVELNTALNVYNEIKPNYFQFDNGHSTHTVGKEITLTPEINLLNGSSISWTIISAPKNSNSLGSLGENETIKFTPDVKGNYVVQGLIKHEGHIIYYATHKVVAHEEGAVLQAAISEPTIDNTKGQVILSGEASTNNIQGDLTYSWMVQGASGFMKNDIQLTVQEDNSVVLQYSNDKTGQVVVKLTVVNEAGSSSSVNKLITL